jgi:spermidine/putrescine transport system permease protein
VNLFHRKPIAPLDYARRTGLRLWMAGVLFFLYAPLLTLVVFSFNDSKRNLVWKGFTFKYYAKAFANEGLMTALANTLFIALVATMIALVLGTLAALLLWRFRFPMKAGLDGAFSLPIVVPEICMGVAMLIFFKKIGWPSDLPWPFSLGSIIVAHATFCFPFVALVVRARLAGFNWQMEEAAKDLGASEWQTFRDVLLPHMSPAMVAGAFLAFTLSLDDFVITFFTSGPETVTFPVKIYSMVRFAVTPEVNAVSTILIVLTVILTVIALKVQGNSADILGGSK